MRYGLDVANLGELADPRRVVELAQVAEQAGWDGLFMWDHLGFAWEMPSADPWVLLAAVAQATSTLRIGTAITPLPRRRPQMVAHALATLDLLSNGRVTFGAGLGGIPVEFAVFGEGTDAKTRAGMLDEGLEIVARLLAGERVNFAGVHYSVDNVSLTPRGLQQPRIPIWIGAESGNALRRAARWDGWVIYTVDSRGKVARSVTEIAQKLATIRHHQQEVDIDIADYDVVVTGMTAPGGGVEEYAAMGATWWLETLHGMRVDFNSLLARVQAGPPR